MTLEPFAQLLKQSMGLDVASVGDTALQRAIEVRQRARQIEDRGAYWASVRGSAAELQALIEAVTVPETWFFRDPQAFAMLRDHVAGRWLRANPHRPVRLLSVPCSTGEEPYSMAMTLLDAGVPTARFRIDAIDISEGVLTHARRGAYRAGAFRGSDVTFRDRFFERADSGFRISERVRESVHFQQGNLTAHDFQAGAEHYDIVFCRNVLIYFDRETQSRAIGALSRLLRPDGFLFVGSSEAGALRNHGFVSANVPMAFAFRAHEAPRDHATIVQPTPGSVPSASRLGTEPAAVPRRVDMTAKRAPAAPSEAECDAGQGLERARQLANQGRFVEAVMACTEEMERAGPSAEGFYLLGLVRDASGNHREAAAYYRKALYLEPDHGEALTHLTLSLQGEGKAAEALVVRRRLNRLAQEPRVK